MSKLAYSNFRIFDLFSSLSSSNQHWSFLTVFPQDVKKNNINQAAYSIIKVGKSQGSKSVDLILLFILHQMCTPEAR